jgi:hypothetical protein
MLRWETIRALPTLRSYDEALKHYNDTTPIRGCEFKMRPVGRRDQKWFNIHKNPDESISLQYGVGGTHTYIDHNGDKQTQDREPHRLITYHPDNTVTLPTAGALGATSRERVSRITSARTGHLDAQDWIYGVSYHDGKEVHGWTPLRDDTKIILPKTTGKAMPTVINARLPRTHRINKQRSKELAEQYAAFTAYLTGIGKLCSGELDVGDRNREHGTVLVSRLLNDLNINTSTDTDHMSRTVALYSNPRWRDEYNRGGYFAKNRDILMQLAASDDVDMHYVAMQWLAAISDRYRWSGGAPRYVATFADMRNTFTQAMQVKHKDTLFEETVHDDGKLHKDRYRKVMSML